MNKKIALKNSWHAKNNKLSLEQFVVYVEYDEKSNYNIVTEYYSLFSSNYLEIFPLDEGTTLYVCGFVSNLVAKKLSCFSCRTAFSIKSKGDKAGCPYFNALQRGGLPMCTDRFCYIYIFSYECFVTTY